MFDFFRLDISLLHGRGLLYCRGDNTNFFSYQNRCSGKRRWRIIDFNTNVVNHQWGWTITFKANRNEWSNVYRLLGGPTTHVQRCSKSTGWCRKRRVCNRVTIQCNESLTILCIQHNGQFEWTKEGNFPWNGQKSRVLITVSLSVSENSVSFPKYTVSFCKMNSESFTQHGNSKIKLFTHLSKIVNVVMIGRVWLRV